MAIQTSYTSCGPIIWNDEWTEEFLASITQLEQGRGSHLTYKEKQGLWLLSQVNPGVPITSFFLTEDGDQFITEDGFQLILE